MIEAIFGMQGALLISFITYIALDQRCHIRHEQRLTRLETKFDAVLRNNGIDCKEEDNET